MTTERLFCNKIGLRKGVFMSEVLDYLLNYYFIYLIHSFICFITNVVGVLYVQSKIGPTISGGSRIYKLGWGV